MGQVLQYGNAMLSRGLIISPDDHINGVSKWSSTFGIAVNQVDFIYWPTVTLEYLLLDVDTQQANRIRSADFADSE